MHAYSSNKQNKQLLKPIKNEKNGIDNIQKGVKCYEKCQLRERFHKASQF